MKARATAAGNGASADWSGSDDESCAATVKPTWASSSRNPDNAPAWSSSVGEHQFPGPPAFLVKSAKAAEAVALAKARQAQQPPPASSRPSECEPDSAPISLDWGDDAEQLEVAPAATVARAVQNDSTAEPLQAQPTADEVGAGKDSGSRLDASVGANATESGSHTAPNAWFMAQKTAVPRSGLVIPFTHGDEALDYGYSDSDSDNSDLRLPDDKPIDAPPVQPVGDLAPTPGRVARQSSRLDVDATSVQNRPPSVSESRASLKRPAEDEDEVIFVKQQKSDIGSRLHPLSVSSDSGDDIEVLDKRQEHNNVSSTLTVRNVCLCLSRIIIVGHNCLFDFRSRSLSRTSRNRRAGEKIGNLQ